MTKQKPEPPGNPSEAMIELRSALIELKAARKRFRNAVIRAHQIGVPTAQIAGASGLPQRALEKSFQRKKTLEP